MDTATIPPIYSSAMQELNAFFNILATPYDKGEIVRFNLAYQRLYPKLSRSEKLRAEKLVDSLLEHLEDENLASKVYGVV